MTKATDNGAKKAKKIHPAWYISGAVILAVILTYTYFFIVTKSLPTWEHRAQFGDMFGGFTALLTAFTFIAIVYTVYLQRNELKLQRRELELQREVLDETRKELKRTADAHTEMMDLKSREIDLQETESTRSTINTIIKGIDTLKELGFIDKEIGKRFRENTIPRLMQYFDGAVKNLIVLEEDLKEESIE